MLESALVPCPKPTSLWMTLWRCPQLPTSTSQAQFAVSASSANSSHVFNISLWAFGFCQWRLPLWQLDIAVTFGRQWWVFAGFPALWACGESVMARLSAGPSPVIRKVNTASGAAWGISGREQRRGQSGSCPVAYLSCPGADLDRQSIISILSNLRRDEMQRSC